MAEKSTFFNSVSGDRKYKAEDMAAHFAKLITNGVYPAGTQLQVTEDTGMDVTVSAGSAWINGYAYHNDDDFTLTFDAADGVLDRIDRIVIRWGRLARSINLAIVKGTPGSSPTAPAIVRSADYYDLGIATVSINAGITAITQAMITDTRLDSDVCGFVSSLIQPDTSDWFTQFNSAFTTALNNNQSTWDTWFATLEDILDENVAGNLLNLINNVAEELEEHKEESTTYDFQQLDKDATTGMYFRFEEYRADATLFRKTVLSNPDVNGYPQTETQTRYDTDGTTVLSTTTYTLSFDSDGLLVSREEVIV